MSLQSRKCVETTEHREWNSRTEIAENDATVKRNRKYIARDYIYVYSFLPSPSPL